MAKTLGLSYPLGQKSSLVLITCYAHFGYSILVVIFFLMRVTVLQVNHN